MKMNSKLIFGYGSLMSQQSALSTMSSASNFRPAILSNYKRVFSLISLSGIIKNTSFLETKEIAALAIRPSFGNEVLGICFEIPSVEVTDYIKREARYKCLTVEVTLPETQKDVKCLTVVEQKEEEFRESLDDRWYEVVGQHYNGDLWERTDIFPMRVYLLNALKSAHHLGGMPWLNNMLDYCYLADGVTTIRKYIASYRSDRFPDKVMEEYNLLGLI